MIAFNCCFILYLLLSTKELESKISENGIVINTQAPVRCKDIKKIWVNAIRSTHASVQKTLIVFINQIYTHCRLLCRRSCAGCIGGPSSQIDYITASAPNESGKCKFCIQKLFANQLQWYEKINKVGIARLFTFHRHDRCTITILASPGFCVSCMNAAAVTMGFQFAFFSTPALRHPPPPFIKTRNWKIKREYLFNIQLNWLCNDGVNATHTRLACKKKKPKPNEMLQIVLFSCAFIVRVRYECVVVVFLCMINTRMDFEVPPDFIFLVWILLKQINQNWLYKWKRWFLSVDRLMEQKHVYIHHHIGSIGSCLRVCIYETLFNALRSDPANSTFCAIENFYN